MLHCAAELRRGARGEAVSDLYEVAAGNDEEAVFLQCRRSHVVQVPRIGGPVVQVLARQDGLNGSDVSGGCTGPVEEENGGGGPTLVGGVAARQGHRRNDHDTRNGQETVSGRDAEDEEILQALSQAELYRGGAARAGRCARAS